MLFPANQQEIPAFIEELKKLNSSQRNDMLNKLVASKNDYKIEILLAALQVVEPERTSEKMPSKAAFLLGELGDKTAIASLLEIFESDAPVETRVSAASALGCLKDGRAFNALLLGLNDPSQDIRTMSAVSLYQLDDKRAVEPLIQLLNRSSNYEANEIAGCLGGLKDGRAFEPMLESLNRCKGEDYCGVVESLGLLNDPRVYDILMNFSKIYDGFIQIASVRGLMFLGDPRAIPRVEWFVEHGDFHDDLNISLKQHALDAIEWIRRQQLKKSKNKTE